MNSVVRSGFLEDILKTKVSLKPFHHTPVVDVRLHNLKMFWIYLMRELLRDIQLFHRLVNISKVEIRAELTEAPLELAQIRFVDRTNVFDPSLWMIVVNPVD